MSKVRSLGLDALDETDLSVLREMGNAKSNAIWEHSLGRQDGWVKPTPESPADHKRRYVQAKYVWKGFVEGSNNRDGDWAGTSSSSSGELGGGDTNGGGAHRRSWGSGEGDGASGLAGAERWSLRLSECAATGDLMGAVEALAHGEYVCLLFGGATSVGLLCCVVLCVVLCVVWCSDFLPCVLLLFVS